MQLEWKQQQNRVNVTGITVFSDGKRFRSEKGIKSNFKSTCYMHHKIKQQTLSIKCYDMDIATTFKNSWSAYKMQHQQRALS